MLAAFIAAAAAPTAVVADEEVEEVEADIHQSLHVATSLAMMDMVINRMAMVKMAMVTKTVMIKELWEHVGTIPTTIISIKHLLVQLFVITRLIMVEWEVAVAVVVVAVVVVPTISNNNLKRNSQWLITAHEVRQTCIVATRCIRLHLLRSSMVKVVVVMVSILQLRPVAHHCRRIWSDR